MGPDYLELVDPSLGHLDVHAVDDDGGMVQLGLAARLRLLRVRGPLVKKNVPSSQSAATPVVWTRPSGLAIESSTTATHRCPSVSLEQRRHAGPSDGGAALLVDAHGWWSG